MNRDSIGTDGRMEDKAGISDTSEARSAGLDRIGKALETPMGSDGVGKPRLRLSGRDAATDGRPVRESDGWSKDCRSLGRTPVGKFERTLPRLGFARRDDSAPDTSAGFVGTGKLKLGRTESSKELNSTELEGKAKLGNALVGRGRLERTSLRLGFAKSDESAPDTSAGFVGRDTPRLGKREPSKELSSTGLDGKAKLVGVGKPRLGNRELSKEPSSTGFEGTGKPVGIGRPRLGKTELSREFRSAGFEVRGKLANADERTPRSEGSPLGRLIERDETPVIGPMLGMLAGRVNAFESKFETDGSSLTTSPIPERSDETAAGLLARALGREGRPPRREDSAGAVGKMLWSTERSLTSGRLAVGRRL